jgi:hypothetical protein
MFLVEVTEIIIDPDIIDVTHDDRSETCYRSVISPFQAARRGRTYRQRPVACLEGALDRPIVIFHVSMTSALYSKVPEGATSPRPADERKIIK